MSLSEDPPKLVTRKERKKAEKSEKFQQLVEEEIEVSPFSVTIEDKNVPEGSRDISLNKVSVSVNGKTLFIDTSVKFLSGSRYGLMGPNGRGKSTILRLIATGELPIQSNLDILLVEQEQEFHESNLSAVEAVIQSHKKLHSYTRKVQVLNELPELSSEQLEELHFLEEELNMMDSTEADAKARRILFGLGFPTDWHERCTSSFSGGWRKRIALASAVFIEPDVLLLDEPTNHLDLNAVIWLEMYISRQYNENAKRKKTLVVVSHDSGFLDSVCTHMVLIERYLLHYFKGAYSNFNQQVKSMHVEFDKQYEKIQKRIHEMKSKGQSNLKVDEYIKEQIAKGKIEEEFLMRRREYTVNFPFKCAGQLRDGCIVKLENVAFGYPDCPELFNDVNFSLWTDSRITLCGPNGIGKSTLLNLLTGMLTPTKGFVTVNRQIRIGRYNQHFVDKLPMDKTPVQCLTSFDSFSEESRARGQLGRFGLEGIVHHNKIETLSGGQKARVGFALISAEMPHFLLMDEPTNHLDLEAIEALCDAINKFEGGVLVVTHDSRLISKTNMVIWVAGNKNVTPFQGDLDDYKDYVSKLVEAEDHRREGAKAIHTQAKIEAKAPQKSEEEKSAAKKLAKEKLASFGKSKKKSEKAASKE